MLLGRGVPNPKKSVLLLIVEQFKHSGFSLYFFFNCNTVFNLFYNYFNAKVLETNISRACVLEKGNFKGCHFSTFRERDIPKPVTFMNYMCL